MNKIIPIYQSMGLQCGDCVFFKNLPKGDVPCSKQGVRKFANAKPCYTPDYKEVCKTISQLAVVSQFASELTPKQTKVFCAMLLHGVKNRKKRYTFGQKVYCCNGSDYLDNYVAAYVVGYAKDKVVVSGSPTMDAKGSYFVGYLFPESILDYTSFKKKRSTLIKQGKLNDPRKGRDVIPTPSTYEPDIPTIDNVPKEWKKVMTREKKRGRFKDVYDRITGNRVIDVSGE